MRSRMYWRAAQLCLLSTLAPAAGIAQTQSAQPEWTFESDGSWLAETVSIGNEGSQVFAEYGAYVNSRALFAAGDVNPPAPVWSDTQTEFNFEREVASAARTGVHASIHHEFMDSNQVWKRAILRCYSSDSATPDWSYEFSTLIGNGDSSAVRISEDGTQLVAAIYDSGAMKTKVAVFGAGSSTPELTSIVDTFGAFEAFVVSADGTTAAFRSSMRLLVVDLATGATLLDQFLINSTFYGSLDITADGRGVAMGTANTVVRYERQSSGNYVQTETLQLGAGNFCAALGLAGNGSTLYYVVNNFSTPSRAQVHGRETQSGTTLLDYQVAGSGSYLNLASGVEVSADGQHVAVGLYGDEGQSVPELLFFSALSTSPVATWDAPGSVVSMDMSPSGHNVAVAARTVHATQFGQGGSISLFEMPDLDLTVDGVPTLGATVELRQRLRESAIARVIVAPALDSSPQYFQSAGLLYLDRSLVTWLPAGSAGAQGDVITSYALPSSPSLVGTSLYFQGVGLAPRDLSDNFVKLTILP